MGILGKERSGSPLLERQAEDGCHKSCGDATSHVAPNWDDYDYIVPYWELDDGPSLGPAPDASAKLCTACGGNAIWWTDVYGERHCAGCCAAPARSMVRSIEVCINVPGGLAWEDNTEKLMEPMCRTRAK